MATIQAHWEHIDGTVPDDLIGLPLDRFLNRGYAWILENMTGSQKDRAKLEVELDRPLPGQQPTTGPWSDESMAKAFAAFEREF